jgi:hypothetical protein
MALKKSHVKKWEVSISEFYSCEGRKFKMAGRLPVMSVAEARIFATKKQAKKLSDEWLK